MHVRLHELKLLAMQENPFCRSNVPCEVSSICAALTQPLRNRPLKYFAVELQQACQHWHSQSPIQPNMVYLQDTITRQVIWETNYAPLTTSTRNNQSKQLCNRKQIGGQMRVTYGCWCDDIASPCTSLKQSAKFVAPRLFSSSKHADILDHFQPDCWAVSDSKMSQSVAGCVQRHDGQRLRFALKFAEGTHLHHLSSWISQPWRRRTDCSMGTLLMQASRTCM